MVRINRVHTGTGDGGETFLLDGTKVGKESLRVAPVSYTHLTLPTIYSV